jgi:hypothetical protein
MTLFTVNPRSSTVEIDLDVNLHPSHVRATGIHGALECTLDRARRPRLELPWSAELELAVASMKSGNGLQDREMRRRMDSKHFPRINATLVKAMLNADGSYHASFDLTIRGRTRRVSGDAKLEVADGVLTVDGEQRLNMKHFGIDPPRLLLLRVNELLTVRAHIVAREQRLPRG